MQASIKEASCAKLFFANNTADDPVATIARGTYILGQLRPLAAHGAVLTDCYVAGGTAVTAACSNSPQ
eukprot:611219-Lingulodinium_polyedra.AAC.1